MKLKEKILNKKARIGIIGLGYVGLPLAVEFAKKGFEVVGIDVNETAVKFVNKGKSYIIDVSDKELKDVVDKKMLSATTDYSVISKLDTVNICVPTPLRKSKDPDVSFIISAVTGLKQYFHKDMLIILESTTYPGTTEEIVRPLLEETGWKTGTDFYLAFSPERVDPGNPKYHVFNTPKVVGGITPACTDVASAFYQQIVDTVVPVSNTQTAEIVKLLENTFRAVNIGLVNEIALMCHKLGLNVWEVINAAKTKPFGFMPFFPGPGLGGHCIPIDPLYLSWKAKFYNFTARFIELADEINSQMPDYVVLRVMDALNDHSKSLKNAKILILGMAYKADITDVRESPSISVLEGIRKKGAEVCYNDPFVANMKIEGENYKSIELTKENLNKMDCCVITTNHSQYDYKFVVENSKIVFDTRDAIKGIVSEKVYKL